MWKKICLFVIEYFFFVIDFVCYKMVKENRRKEELIINNIDIFLKINFILNGYGFKLFCYYLYWIFRLLYVYVKEVLFDSILIF